jgi:DNA polymerase-4
MKANTAIRRIIHCDMDAFFASVEQRDRAELRGKPVIVGGGGPRGVVAAASYEARAFGVRSAMPGGKALSLCPQAIVVPPDLNRYRQVSQEFHRILADYSDQIESLGLDEAYIDVSEDQRALGSGTANAQEIRQRVSAELDLTCSTGVAPSKLVAKIASDYRKPDGCTVVGPDQVVDFLAPLPVRRIPGIGPVAGRRLEEAGIRLIADLRSAEAPLLDSCLGRQADYFRRMAWGDDDRPVATHRERKQVSVEDTFPEDLVGREACLPAIQTLCDILERRCQRIRTSGRTLTLKVRQSDFTTQARSLSVRSPIQKAADTLPLAELLLADLVGTESQIRLLGLAISGLDRSGAVQEQIDFDYDVGADDQSC